MHVPSILVVLDAAWPELFARCLGAAVRSGMLVHRCEVAAAATWAAERRPVLIVLSEAVFALDPEEFEALARDVRASLLKVDEDITERELEAMFSAALRDRDRDRRDDGRSYALIRQIPAEEPLPRASQPPAPRATQAPPPPSMRGATLRGAPPVDTHAPPMSARGAQLGVPRPSPGAPTASRAVATPPPPPPPPVRAAPPRPSPGAPPSSMRGDAPPSRSGLPPPPSVRGAQLGGPQGPVSSRSAPEAGAQPSPPSMRSAQFAGPPSSQSPNVAAPPHSDPAPVVKAAPPSAQADPLSGVRPCGADALDAVFEEQDLPHETLARGPRTR